MPVLLMEPEAALTGIACAVISAVVQGRKRRGVSETQPGLHGDSCSETTPSSSPLSHHAQCGEEQRSSGVSAGNQSAVISSLHNSLKKGQKPGSTRASRNRVKGATEKRLVRLADRTQAVRYSLRRRGKPEQRLLRSCGHAGSDLGSRDQSATSRGRPYKGPKQRRGIVSVSKQAGTLRDVSRRRAHPPSAPLEGYEGGKRKAPQRLSLFADADGSKSPVGATTGRQQEASSPASHEGSSSSSGSDEKVMLCSGGPRNYPLTRDNVMHTGWERHAGELPCGSTFGGGESPRSEERQYFLRNRGKLGDSPCSDDRRDPLDSLKRPVTTPFGRKVAVSSVRVLRALRRCDDGLKAGQRLRPGTGKERKVTGFDYKHMERKKRTPRCERTSVQSDLPEGRKERPTEGSLPDTSRRRRRCSLSVGQDSDAGGNSAVTLTEETYYSGEAGTQVSVVKEVKMKDAFGSPSGGAATDLHGRRDGGDPGFLAQLPDSSGIEGEAAGEPKKPRGGDDCGRRLRTKDIERMRGRTPGASRQTEKTAEEALGEESKEEDAEDRSKTTGGAAERTSGIEGNETEAWQRLQRRAEDRGRSRLLPRKRLTRPGQAMSLKEERQETEEVTDAGRFAGEKAAPGETLTGQRSSRGRRRVESRLRIREAVSEEQAGAPVRSEEHNSSAVGGKRQVDAVEETGEEERQETPLENSGEQEGCCEGGQDFKGTAGGDVCDGNILGEEEKNREKSSYEGDEGQKPAQKKDHEREEEVEKEVCFMAEQTSEAEARTRDVMQDSMGADEDRQERDSPEENAKPGRPPCGTGRWHLRPRRQTAGHRVNTSCDGSSFTAGVTAVLLGSSEGGGRLDERTVTTVSTSRRDVSSSTLCTSGTGVPCSDRGVRGTTEPSCAGPVADCPEQPTCQETASDEKVREHGSLEDAPDSCSDAVNGNRKRRQCEEVAAGGQTLAEKTSLLSALQVGTVGSQHNKEKTKPDAGITGKRLRRRGREDARGIKVQKPVPGAAVCAGNNDVQIELRAPDDTVEPRRKVDRGPETRAGQRGCSAGEETLGKRREEGHEKSEELKADLTVVEKETPVQVDKGKEKTSGPNIVSQDNEHSLPHCATGDSPGHSRLLSYPRPSPDCGLPPPAEPSACFAASCALLSTSTADGTRSGCVDHTPENPSTVATASSRPTMDRPMREHRSEDRHQEAGERNFVFIPREGTFFPTEKGENQSLRSEEKGETEKSVAQEGSLRGEARAGFMTFRRNSFSKRDSSCDEPYSFPPSASPSQVSYQPFCSPPFCSPTVCSFVSPLRQPASRPPSLLSSSSRGFCSASRASAALEHSTAEVLTPQNHRGSRFRSESSAQPYNSFSSPGPRPPSSSPRPVGTSLCSVPPQAPSSAGPSAASSVRRRGSESSVLSGSMILAVAAKASNFKHLPPPLSPFKGPPRPGAAEAARKRRRQQRRQERERRRVKQSAESKTEKENVQPQRKEGDQGMKQARKTSPSLCGAQKQAELLFSRPCGSERDSSPLSGISDSPSESSCQSWMCGISPSSLSPLPAPPDLFWRSSPSAGSEAGRISLSSFPSSPSLLWGGRGCAPGSYFGSSGSLDHSSSSQVSNASFCSSIVFAKPVLPPLANARVTSGGRLSGGEEEGTWRAETRETGQRAPSVRKGWQEERIAGRSPNSMDVCMSGQRHKKTKGDDAPAELCRQRVSGCIFRPPSASVGRLGRRSHMVSSSSNTTSAAGSSLDGPGALPSGVRGGKPVGPCSGEAAGVSFLSAAKAAPPGFFLDDPHLVSGGTRNPLSSGAMLLSASWGVSYHFPRNNKDRGGGTALHANGGSGILQSSPLVRRARRLSEGGAEGRVASRKSLECVGEGGGENVTHTAAAEVLS